MGHGILYCATCQEQLRDTDFDKELAYRLEGQSFCEKCARDLIHTLPEDRVNDILRAFESTHDEPAPPPPPMSENHGNRTTRILKALSASPGIRLTSTSRRMATVKVEEGSSSLLVGIGIAVVILVVLAIYGISADSSSPKHLPAKAAPRR